MSFNWNIRGSKVDKEENLYLIGSMKEQTLFFVSIDDEKF